VTDHGESSRLDAVVAAVDEAGAGANRVAVAVGGGADSAVLLAAGARAPSIRNLRALFVHHHLAHSDLLEGAVRRLTESLAIPLVVLDGAVADGPDLEARARSARYTAMERELADGDVAMTGHTMDDQAETVLMRLADGAGATGLSGIPLRRGIWRRPFLGFRREELRSIAGGLGLAHVEDPANRDPRFTRSRVRHEVLPIVEANLGPGSLAGLARSARLIAADDAVIVQEAARVPLATDGERVMIPAAAVSTLPPAVASRVCRRALRMVNEGGHAGTSGDVEAILETARTGRSSQLSSGPVAVIEGPHVVLGPPRVAPEPVEVAPPAEGTPSRFVSGSDRYAVHRLRAAPRLVAGGRFTVIDADALGGRIVVRAVAPGDRIDIGIGSTPVSELLRAHGVAVPQRRVSLVVTDGAKIAAVVGVRTASWARPREGADVVVVEREVVT
jgi:tRNA(Ile)-lysidine synthetase-like protein